MRGVELRDTSLLCRVGGRGRKPPCGDQTNSEEQYLQPDATPAHDASDVTGMQ